MRLCAPFDDKEISDALFQIGPLKAPGPDGFTNRVYACCWSIIKLDLLRALDAFYHGDTRGMPAINKALVSLLPKMDGAEELRDFRPVSMAHSAIKMFDKVLASRLVDDLPRLVGKHQSAFVKGRYLHDNFMLVQGTARRLHVLRDPTVLLKLDISKAFDSVEWPFLLEVLHAMGFGQRWIGWICGLLATSSTRVMINEVQGKPICNKCGLRQGNPMSPMLFLLVMEPLQRLFHRAAELGLLAPLAPSGLRHKMSIFAEDVMVFLKPHMMDLRACSLILEIFAAASGLKANLRKSAALPIRCTQDQMEVVVDTLGCSLGRFPIRYVGLPYTIRRQSAAQLQGLVEHIATCLPTWRASSLPKSGRLLLVMAVLSSMPIHAMLAMELPAKIIKAINKILRGFLWCGKAEAKGGNCSVAWPTVCAPKWAGGLGIPDLKWMNIAMQARWPWLARHYTTH